MPNQKTMNPQQQAFVETLKKVADLKNTVVLDPNPIPKPVGAGGTSPLGPVQQSTGENQEWKETDGKVGISIGATAPSHGLFVGENRVLVGSESYAGIVKVGDGKSDTQNAGVVFAKDQGSVRLNGADKRVEVEIGSQIRAFLGFSDVIEKSFGFGEAADAVLVFIGRDNKPTAAFSPHFAFTSTLVTDYVWSNAIHLGPNKKDALDSSTIRIDGDSGDIFLQNADIAEDFDILPDQISQAGMVMVMGNDGKLRPCEEEHDTRVVGVISGAGAHKPALVLDRKQQSGRMPIALMGKVFCFVDAHDAPIQAGDLLTTGSRRGHARKVIAGRDFVGNLVGKALAPLRNGSGLLPILVGSR